jgi:hypothetical protein
VEFSQANGRREQVNFERSETLQRQDEICDTSYNQSYISLHLTTPRVLVLFLYSQGEERSYEALFCFEIPPFVRSQVFESQAPKLAASK